MDRNGQTRQSAVIETRRDVFKVVIFYALLATLWIWGSDQLVFWVFPDVEVIKQFQLYKGWIFVFVTSALLLWILLQFVDTLKGWEDTLERSRDHLREIFDSMGTAIAMTDLHGTFTYVNPAYLELFGYSRNELLGRHVAITGMEGEEPSRTPEGTIEHAREHAEGWRGEALRVDKRGRVIPVYLTVSGLYDPEGKLYGFLGDMVDLRSVKEWPPHLGGFALSLQRLAHKSSFAALGEAAVTEAVVVTGGEVGLVAMYDEQHRALRCPWSVGYEDEAPPRRIGPNQGLWGKVLEQRRTLWVDETAEVDIGLSLMPGVQVEAVVIVPILFEERLLGVLMVGTRQRSHSFGDHQINMLEAIAGTLAAGHEREQSSLGYVPSIDERDPPAERPPPG